MPVVFVVRPEARMTHADFETLLRRSVATRSGELALSTVPPRVSVMPFAKQPMALVHAAARPSHAPGLTIHAYRIESKTPVEGPVRGVGMVTLFRRTPELDRASFIRRWHEGHTPLAIEVHPLTRYVRHVVCEALDGAPTLDGIVLEQVRERADLLYPWRFFGGSLRMLPNMKRIWADAARFIDLSTIENHLVDVEPLGLLDRLI